MEIRPIKTEADYWAALKEIESHMSAQADTPEGDYLDILVLKPSDFAWSNRVLLWMTLFPLLVEKIASTKFWLVSAH